MLNDVKVGYTIASSTLRRGNKKTIALTVFVLSLIFVNLIFMPSMINGMMDIFVGAVTDYTYGNIVIEPRKQKSYIENADSIIDKVNNINGVSGVSKRLASGASLRHKQKVVGTSIIGLIPDEEIGISKFNEIVRDGNFLTRMSRDEIMIGSLLAGKEGGPEIYDDLGGVKVGTRINVTYSNGVTRQYKIIGIHEAGPEMSDLITLVHYKELEDVLGIKGENKATSIVIKVDKEGSEPEIKEKIIGVGVKEQVFTWQEKVLDLIRDFLKSFGMLNMLSEVVSLIIAAFIIFIIIYINTLNKKKQIGILKAVGITPGSIIFSYMLISLFYILLGIIFGGIMLAMIVGYLTANPLVFYETMSLAPVVQTSVVVQSVISLILMALVAGFIPAWLVTRQDILKAIWGR